MKPPRNEPIDGKRRAVLTGGIVTAAGAMIPLEAVAADAQPLSPADVLANQAPPTLRVS